MLNAFNTHNSGCVSICMHKDPSDLLIVLKLKGIWKFMILINSIQKLITTLK